MSQVEGEDLTCSEPLQSMHGKMCEEFEPGNNYFFSFLKRIVAGGIEGALPGAAAHPSTFAKKTMAFVEGK